MVPTSRAPDESIVMPVKAPVEAVWAWMRLGSMKPMAMAATQHRIQISLFELSSTHAEMLLCSHYHYKEDEFPCGMRISLSSSEKVTCHS